MRAPGGPQLREYAPAMRKSWGLLLAHVPWDQLGARLYEAIFTVAPVLQVVRASLPSRLHAPHGPAAWLGPPGHMPLPPTSSGQGNRDIHHDLSCQWVRAACLHN